MYVCMYVCVCNDEGMRMYVCMYVYEVTKDTDGRLHAYMYVHVCV
jgi:hypothetical protein